MRQMKLHELEGFVARLPLSFEVRHAASSRRSTEALLIRVRIDAAEGWGETVVRPYLTGETLDGCKTAITTWAATLRGFEGSPQDWIEQLQVLASQADRDRQTAAFCGFELACLDALARAEQQTVGALLGLSARPLAARNWRLPHAQPLLTQDERRLRWLSVAATQRQLALVKVKVGLDESAEQQRARLQAVRRVVGPKMPIWIDANGAWSTEQAIAEVSDLNVSVGIDAVEQPLAQAARSDLLEVQRATGVAVSADESLQTRADADELLALGSCSIWNLRLAKCGGLLNTRAIAARALTSGISLQIGSLVGETSLLGAAAIWLAASLPAERICCFEACLGAGILRQDLAYPRLGSAAELQPGPGLGVRLDRAALQRCITDSWRIE